MTPLWCHEGIKGQHWRTAWLITFLVVEAFWEFSSLNRSVAYGQSQSYAEIPPYAEKKVEDTKIIPSVTLTERYDSNVLYIPSGLNVGRTKWDFITSLAPTIQVLNKNRYVETDVTAGANGSVFVNNPDLKFVSTALRGSAVLDGFINRFIRGAKLQVADSFSFSPESPSFVTAATPVSTDNPFARGLVPVRANLYQNTAAVKAAYPISSTISLQGDYSYSLLRVGNVLVAQQQPSSTALVFFNTDYHTWSVGPNWRLSRSDNVSLAFKSTTSNLRDTSGQFADTSFTARGAEAIYATRAADWAATLSGGATVLEQRVYSTGTLTLSTKYGDSTQVQVTASRQMAPAFFGVPGALISTAGGISVEHTFDKGLSLIGNANYAHNEIAPVKNATFDSYSASAVLAYRVSRSVTTSLQYSYTYFEINSLNVATQSETGYLTNRHFVTFSITASWN